MFPIVNLPRLETNGEFQGMRMFLNLLRVNPELLDDETVLKHFIAANDCQNGNAVMRGFASEFDYPSMKTFYKSKAPEILKEVPNSIHILLTGFFLGQYDTAKSLFPFTDARGQMKPTVLVNISPNNDLKSCGVAGQNLGKNDMFYGGGPGYVINFKPITVSELSINEADARKFVDSQKFYRPGMGRAVELLVEVDVVQSPAKVGSRQPNGAYPPFNFNGTVKKITVIANSNMQPIGTVFP